MEEVLVAQAKQEFEKKNYQNFQTLLLRARKPEIVIKQYQVELYSPNLMNFSS